MHRLSLLAACVLLSGCAARQSSVSPAPYSAAQPLATGVVFNDVNRNGVRDPGERGLRNVLVSNQIEVVKTDRDGRWELPVRSMSLRLSHSARVAASARP